MSGIETAEVRRNKSYKSGDGRAWELWWREICIATSRKPVYLRQYAKLNGWAVGPKPGAELQDGAQDC